MLLPPGRAFAAATLLLATFLTSCTRNEDEKVLLDRLSVASINSTTDCIENIDIGAYSVETPVPTVLGAPLNGAPFSVDNMKIAAKNLYGTSSGVSNTNLYMRFRPANEDQLKTLLEFADNNGWDLFDYPLDRDVLTEGDYYPQPDVGENEMPWFYTVITNLNYTYPSGIQYEILQNLYISDNIALENEALRITNNIISEDCGNQSFAELMTPPDPSDPIDPENPNPPPPVVPNNPGPTSKTPAGHIRIWDKQLQTGHGVPRARIIARRWFKIDRAETDNDGYFRCNRTFRNKVNILVQMKGSNLEIRHIRGARFWQMWFSVKTSIGKYSGTLNNINHHFVDDNSETSNRHMYWYAGTVMRSFVDYNTLAVANQIGQAPTNMRILLTTWGQGHSTPMNKKRNNSAQAPQEWIEYFLAHPTLAVNAQMSNYLYNAKLLPEIDMSLSYRQSNMSSSNAREGIYHELAHAAHFNQVGQQWWNSFVYAVTSETQRFGIMGANSPYGDGTMGSTSDYIGLAESWAYYLGHFMANQTYGPASAPLIFAEESYFNDSPVMGLSSHLNALEDFTPANTDYPFRWLPSGLYYDLLDDRAEAVPVTDNVTGYTNQHFFGALTSDVTSIQQFKAKLLTNNGFWQQNEVNVLFSNYGY